MGELEARVYGVYVQILTEGESIPFYTLKIAGIILQHPGADRPAWYNAQ